VQDGVQSCETVTSISFPISIKGIRGIFDYARLSEVTFASGSSLYEIHLEIVERKRSQNVQL
jgi:hypothetical protein